MEGLVAFLLLATILLCALLNRRIRLLRADEQVLRTVIFDLNNAVTRADKAVAELRALSGETEHVLQDGIQKAEEMSVHLSHSVREGERVWKRITTIVNATDPFSEGNRSSNAGVGVGRAA